MVRPERGFVDARDGLRVAPERPAVRVTGEHRAAKREARERVVAVEDLDALRVDLALQARDLVGLEARAREEEREEAHERVHVSAQDRPVDRECGGLRVEPELGSDAIELRLEGGRAEVAGAAAQHARVEGREARVRCGLEDRPALACDDDVDDGQGGRRLDDDVRARGGRGGGNAHALRSSGTRTTTFFPSGRK